MLRGWLSDSEEVAGDPSFHPAIGTHLLPQQIVGRFLARHERNNSPVQ